MNSRRMLANSRSFAQNSRSFQGKKPIFEFKEFSRAKHKFKEFSRLVRTMVKVVVLELALESDSIYARQGLAFTPRSGDWLFMLWSRNWHFV